jgi:DHA3 family macrolide efflux protein-like MFS transporter
MNNSTHTVEQQWMGKFMPIWVAQIFSLLGRDWCSSLWFGGLRKRPVPPFIWYWQLRGNLARGAAVPLCGALVDRYNRRIIMILADGLVALFTLGLAILFALGLAEIWHIFVTMFCAPWVAPSIGLPCSPPPR